MKRSFVMVGVGLLALYVAAASAALAQTADYRGTVVNSQFQGSPAQLTVSFTSTNQPFAGYITIGPPLGGSGSFTGWKSRDTLYLRSISVSGDTILWISPVIGTYLAGPYRIIGGQYRQQVGMWSAQFDSTLGDRSAPSTDAVAVEVVDQSEGSVGQRLVYLLREEFRRSSAFRLTEAPETRIQLIVSAMPRFTDTPNTATIYAIVWNLVLSNDQGGWNTFYYENTLGYAGSDVLQQSAQTIAARTDRLIADLRRALQGPNTSRPN